VVSIDITTQVRKLTITPFAILFRGTAFQNLDDGRWIPEILQTTQTHTSITVWSHGTRSWDKPCVHQRYQCSERTPVVEGNRVPYITTFTRHGVVVLHDAMVAVPLDEKGRFALSGKILHCLFGCRKYIVLAEPKIDEKIHRPPRPP
jgi:hypothetical protein